MISRVNKPTTYPFKTERTTPMPTSKVFNIDCMEYMKDIPDKYFQLAVVDPPYGIGATITIGSGDMRSGTKKGKKWIDKDWDNERPTEDYFREVIRISANQIISGGNYFADLLPPTRCYIVWDKMQRVNHADAELMWTSFKKSTRVFNFHASKIQGFLNPNRFHPTEKPVALYKWILANYAKPGDKIIDTHMGSQSSRIAAWDMGFDFYGTELDKEYFDQGNARFEVFKQQQKLF